MRDNLNQSKQQSTSRRSLVGEILVTQLGYAAIIGVVALTSLWTGASWIIRENMAEFAQRWIDDLDSLGVGLYSDSGGERLLRVEGYVAKFPEIAYVRYYDPTGQVIFLETGAKPMPAAPILRDAELDQLRTKLDSGDTPHLEHNLDQTLIRISTAIHVTSMDSDGLFETPSLADVATEDEIVGFVELGLDYSRLDAQLLRHTRNAGSAVALAFLLLALVGRILLRRALQPLRDIQEPLTKLANGETDFEVAPSSHKEIEAITNSLGTAVSRIRERDTHLRYLAEHDDLTGLPNRHAFMNMLRSMLDGHAQPLNSVLFVDLDQFKYVNDTLGHLAGDAILKQVAARMRSSAGDMGTTARFGGDEFGVIVAEKGHEQQQEHAGQRTPASIALADRITAAVADFPFIYGSQSFNLTCSIGIAHAKNLQTQGADELLAYADLACQKAKADGRNRIRVYEPDAGTIEAIRYDIGWSQKLKSALKHNDFELLFQPIVHIASGETSHFEVLLRFKDEDGLHSPGAFLSAASRFGLMNDIDHWVIENAFRRLAWFRRQDPELRFTINVSGGAFAEGGLVELVRHNLQRYALEPGAVIFEITEQVAVENFIDTTLQINELIELGCEFALDDFGTGYSSFTYLKKLPMQYVKIDGQFIQHMHDSEIDQAVVRAMVQVAKALGKKVVAEFVTHEATLKLLAEYGVDYAQGYLLGKPQQQLITPARLQQPAPRRNLSP